MRIKSENHMHLDMHRAKRCGARTRSGRPCQSPAMANGRCRMHGGSSPGHRRTIGMRSSMVATLRLLFHGEEKLWQCFGQLFASDRGDNDICLLPRRSRKQAFASKGQQKVTVEHVHVHEGGEAIVGNVEGGGIRTKSENRPHALGYAPGQTLRSENAEREAVPVASDGNR
jgi:hypothetical protein